MTTNRHFTAMERMAEQSERMKEESESAGKSGISHTRLAELMHLNELRMKLMTERYMLEPPPKIIIPKDSDLSQIGIHLGNIEPVVQNATAPNHAATDWHWWDFDNRPSTSQPLAQLEPKVEMLPMGKRKIRLE